MRSRGVPSAALLALFSWLPTAAAEFKRPSRKTCKNVVAALPVKRNDTAPFIPCGDILQRRFQAAVDDNCGGRCDVVFIGDSITEHSGVATGCELIGSSAEKSFFAREAAVFRSAVSAALNQSGLHPPLVLAAGMEQTQNMLWRLPRLLPLRSSPRVFVVLLGTNNLHFGGQSPWQVVCGLEEIVRELHVAHPTSKIIVRAVYPRGDMDNYYEPLVNRTNEVLQRAVRQAEAPWLSYLDCNDHIRMDKEHMPDLLHPNAAQYKLLYGPCIMPAVWKAVGMDAGPLIHGSLRKLERKLEQRVNAQFV